MSQDKVFDIDWDVDYEGLRSEVAQYLGDIDVKQTAKEHALSMGAALPTNENSDVEDVDSYSVVSPYDKDKGEVVASAEKAQRTITGLFTSPDGNG